jgi:crotonobetaine/carnitine-CoA ligase
MTDLIGNRTLPILLDEVVERHPNKTFLVFEDRAGATAELTYRELLDRVERAAGGLERLGIGRGDTVAVHLRNSPEFVVSLLALAKLGAVLVPCNVANRAHETSYVLERSDAKLVVTSPDYLDLFAEVVPSIPDVTGVVVARGNGTSVDSPIAITRFEDLLEAPPRRARTELASEDPVQILFTSGTTARPKGVVLTHANCLWSGEREARHYGFRDEDRLLTALPLFHVNAQSFALLPTLTVGGTLVLLEEYRATKFWEQVRRHRATHTTMVAMMVRTLLLQSTAATDREHSLRTLNYAINVTDAEKAQFEERFAVSLINGYGLSEAMIGVAAAPLHGDRRWPSVGLPAIDREVRVVDEKGSELPPGEVGEIVVKGVPGRTLMKCYYKDPEETSRAIVDGWLHTGDNGMLDELGYLYFLDRKKDVIKRAGENVSATEVERTLLEHPKVSLAAVIAVPDPIRDEAVKAFVVVADGETLTEDEVVSHCSERLAAFKVPTVIEFRAALPLTSVGKVEKKLLREEEAARG